MWPSEERIYGRHGFGVASFGLSVDVAAAHAGVRWAVPEPPARLVPAADAFETVAPVYEEVRRRRVGLIGRSETWWRVRRLGGASPDPSLFVAEWPGRGYAIYRMRLTWDPFPDGTVEVVEAAALSPDVECSIWAWLFSMDLARRVVADRLPVDHPILYIATEPRRLQARLSDNVWLRLLDVGAALAKRCRGHASAVLDIADGCRPSNAGRWEVGQHGVARTDAPADVAVDVADLASVYLGAATFALLARGGRALALTPDGVARADAALPSTESPWTPEVF